MQYVVLVWSEYDTKIRHVLTTILAALLPLPCPLCLLNQVLALVDGMVLDICVVCVL